MVTNLVAEIANKYYELLGLDTQLKNVNENIDIQSNALVIVKQQKQSAKVTELAVKRFEAQLFNTKSLKFDIDQYSESQLSELSPLAELKASAF